MGRNSLVTLTMTMAHVGDAQLARKALFHKDTHPP